MIDFENRISELIKDTNSTVSEEWAQQALKDYPFFTLPAILYLKSKKGKLTPDDENLLGRVAITTPDRKALYNILGEDCERFRNFYPEEPKFQTPDTDKTIDGFLDRFGGNSEQEISILEQVIFNPTPDYAQVLANEEEKSVPQLTDSVDDPQQSLIDKFIAKSKEQQGHYPSQVVNPISDTVDDFSTDPIDQPAEADDSMLSESLAKIYIKQKKYSKALEIIKSLSLKYPEKSIYFADQIRFLKKLIYIEQKIKK